MYPLISLFCQNIDLMQKNNIYIYFTLLAISWLKIEQLTVKIENITTFKTYLC